jgi:hypothetical protein
MSAPFTSVSSSQSGESSPCVLSSEWVLTRTHSGPSDYTSDVIDSMTCLHDPDFESDYVPSDPYGPMFSHRNSHYPVVCITNQTSPHVVVTDGSMPTQVPSDCQTSHDFAMDDESPSVVFRDESMSTQIPSDCQTSYDFVMDDETLSVYGGDSSPYYGSSVLGPSFYGGYNIGSPRTEGDMMMRAYLASRRG